uniref:Uncharacterized protein n=1 Tax=Peronospora matthiolae TaxID=2874970 RepID=A0AAV1TMP6_9STRA
MYAARVEELKERERETGKTELSLVLSEGSGR